jgi:uncharacterized protein (DUF1697 family)
VPDYVALLRAINVGGRNSLPMEKLRNVLAEQGASSVATYIQSGNVVFSHSRRGAAKLTAQLASAITAAAGFEVPVLLRTRAEWTAAIANNPYGEADVHCAFLPAAPSKTALAKIDPKPFAPSKFTLVGRELYLYLPSGIGRSKLAGAISRALPDATVRNWRTVARLGEMLADLA